MIMIFEFNSINEEMKHDVWTHDVNRWEEV